MIVAVLQSGLPVVLIAIFFAYPPSNAVGYYVSAVAIAATVAALALAALWIVVPWWIPYVQLLLLLLATLAHNFCSPRCWNTFLPTRKLSWVLVVSAFMLIGLSGPVIFKALLGRFPPNDEIVDIAAPLYEQALLVVNGGSDRLINPHMKTLDQSVERFQKWRGQSYGVDIVMTNSIGGKSEGWMPADPSAYSIFGASVYAPCAGRVISSQPDLPDMQVPEMDRAHMLGNHVVIDCGSFWLVLAHFRSDTISVSKGDRVTIGTILGQVGNSGNTGMPHLHIHAQRAGSADGLIAGDPLPISIERRFLVRNDRPSFSPARD